MKYQITVIDEEGLKYVVADLDSLTQARARFEFIQETNKYDDILTVSPKWRSIVLSQVKPILTVGLDVAEELP